MPMFGLARCLHPAGSCSCRNRYGSRSRTALAGREVPTGGEEPPRPCPPCLCVHRSPAYVAAGGFDEHAGPTNDGLSRTHLAEVDGSRPGATGIMPMAVGSDQTNAGGSGLSVRANCSPPHSASLHAAVERHIEEPKAVHLQRCAVLVRDSARARAALIDLQRKVRSENGMLVILRSTVLAGSHRVKGHADRGAVPGSGAPRPVMHGGAVVRLVPWRASMPGCERRSEPMHQREDSLLPFARSADLAMSQCPALTDRRAFVLGHEG